ncbi:MAG: hypothetical protein JNM93_08390 [Bacteriovoracaceae bacterium]|nr:hypothetical protein [Bacteriovoracaceae bacterium]
MQVKLKKTEVRNKEFSYHGFEQLDGDHSFKKAVPGAYVEYQVRKRHGGKVVYFNFELAREMGLIESSHPDKFSKKLESVILDTFGIVIINEYDLIHKTKFAKEDIKPKKYMATRYLQLQHPCPTGKTSGDGRSIWNGEFAAHGKVWDVTSCGTGATCLSPATHKYKKFFKTGDPTISYGCGYSETDEGLSTAIFSDILHKNQHSTERVLAILEFEKNIGITVRAHPCLLRPSHFFNHLKQGNLEALEQITDYFIERMKKNKSWKNVPTNRTKKYDYFLEKVSHDFAKAAAKYEDDYIFCWFDWDGDNTLMNGGIIDYGSIRQFGMFHHEYRYDDVERYSTSIKEQKQKSKYIVQTFVQLVDFLKTGQKKNITSFKSHAALNEYEKTFEYYKNYNLIYKIGFAPSKIEGILSNKKNMHLVSKFRSAFTYFERAKSQRGIYKVADGITWDAIFCMRDILRELPQLLLLRNQEYLSAEEFIEIIRSSYAKKNDLKIAKERKIKIQQFQKYYLLLLKAVGRSCNTKVDKMLLEITMRSSIINKYERVTGDSITIITDKILHTRPSLQNIEIYEILQEFGSSQNLNPDKTKSKPRNGVKRSSVLYGMFKIVNDYREGI